MNEHEQLVDRAARDAQTVLFLGGLDAGKSTLARAVAAFALRLGRTVAYLDADVAQKTVGPPGDGRHEAHPRRPTTSRSSGWRRPTRSGSWARPRRRITCCRWCRRSRGCSDRARAEGADLLIVDTGGRSPASAASS